MNTEENKRAKGVPGQKWALIGSMASITMFASMFEIEDDQIRIVMGGDPEDGMIHPEKMPEQTISSFFTTRTAMGMITSMILQGAEYDLSPDGGVLITRGKIEETTWRESIAAFRKREEIYKEADPELNPQDPEKDDTRLSSAELADHVNKEGDPTGVFQKDGYRIATQSEDGEIETGSMPGLTLDTTLTIIDWMKNKSCFSG